MCREIKEKTNNYETTLRLYNDGKPISKAIQSIKYLSEKISKDGIKCFSRHLFIRFPSLVLEFPQEFSSRNLGIPTITFKEEETAHQMLKDPTAVSLVCTVELLNGIGSWDNVTYRIEWFSGGTPLQDPLLLCEVPPGQRKNNNSCPGSTSLTSVLTPGNKYKAGMWVSGMLRTHHSQVITQSFLNEFQIHSFKKHPYSEYQPIS